MSLFTEEKQQEEVLVEEVDELTLDQLKAIKDNGNLYEVLGVGVKATEEEVQGAYKRRALRLHPDKHSRSENREAYQLAFEKLNLAKVTLTDSEKRRAYDIKKGFAREGRFTYSALKELRKEQNEDFRRIEYEIFKEAQLERAKMYQDIHESDQIVAFNYIAAECQAHVLEKIRNEGLTHEMAAKYATEYLGRSIVESEIVQWTEDEANGKTLMHAISRKDAEEGCELINEKGKFTGYGNFENFAGVMKGGDTFEGAKEVVSGVSDKLRASILEQREKKKREAAEKSRAAADAAAAVFAEKKRLRDEADKALNDRLHKKPKLDDTTGFTKVADVHSKSKKAKDAPVGTLAMFSTLNPAQPPADEQPEEEAAGEGLGGLLGCYDSE